MPVEASEKVSLLAIAWDRKVQVAKLVKSELKIYGKWTLESSAIGVAWLDDQVSFLFFFFCILLVSLFVFSMYQINWVLVLVQCYLSTCIIRSTCFNFFFSKQK